MTNISLVCLAAGMSKRFGGELKQFAKVGPRGETLIEYIINQAISAGFSKIIFVVREETKEQFKKIFEENYKGIPVFYAIQGFDKEKRDKPWGTGDALCSTIDFIQEPFVICSGDDISGEKSFILLSTHLKNKKDEATVAKKLMDMLPFQGTVNRGIFRVNDKNQVIDSEEVVGIGRENFKKKGFREDDLVSISIFALHPETLGFLNEKLAKFKEENKGNRKIEFYLNINLAELIKERKIKMEVYTTEEEWMGITNKEDEEKVRKKIKKDNKK
ncbi:MAG: NTP transferase domain-containing protein [archaeon]